MAMNDLEPKPATPYFIAEVGSNHDAIFYRALNLITLAADAGADAVKFQLFRADVLSTRRRLPPSAWGRLKTNELPDEWLPLLKQAAHDAGLDFLCTAYDAWGLQVVAPHVKDFKIASYELPDDQFLAQVAERCKASRTGQKVILSTGMATLDEVDHALDVLGDVIRFLLHCTTAYPAPDRDMNVSVLQGVDHGILPWLDGLSDHSRGTAAAIAATALGAACIEKHLTDDRTRVGPDHPFALEPTEFKHMVTECRRVAIMLGDGKKGPQPSEQEELQHRSTGEVETGYGTAGAAR